MTDSNYQREKIACRKTVEMVESYNLSFEILLKIDPYSKVPVFFRQSLLMWHLICDKIRKLTSIVYDNT